MRRTVVACCLFLALCAPRAGAFTAEEHRRLALEALGEFLGDFNVTITAEALAEITVRSSRDDMSPARFHVRGKTPYEQAAAISPERMERIVADVVESPPTEHAFAPYADNVVANYDAYHTIALACARKSHAIADSAQPAKEDRAAWAEAALVYEAVAIGYLADAFSSSHLLTPIHLPLAGMQGENVRAAHDFFATQGAYVQDGNGRAWQTFGDGLLRWYGPAYEHVAHACEASVHDVARAVDPDHFSHGIVREHRLDLIPMVVVAAWRYDDRYYLQFREPGLHDPALEVDTRFLYSQGAVPPHLVLPAVRDGDAARLIRRDPRLVSVEYHQTLDVPPAFAGLLVIAGGGALVEEDGGGGVGSVAAGYGWEFRMPLLARLRTSLEAEYLYRLGDRDRRVFCPRYTVGIGSPVLPLVEAAHLEVGYGWGLKAPFRDQGVNWGVGVGTKPVRFPFTYAGVSARLKYERFWMDDTLDGFQLQLVFR
jgi:hypothetical protein